MSVQMASRFPNWATALMLIAAFLLGTMWPRVRDVEEDTQGGAGTVEGPRPVAGLASVGQSPTDSSVGGRINGRVVDLDGHPLRHVLVRATNVRTGTGAAALTDRAGAFQLSELRPGEYTVSAVKAGFVSLQYGQQAAFDLPRSLTIDSAGVADVTLALKRGGAIVGTVTDELGEPMAGVALSVWRAINTSDGRRLAEVEGADGAYHTDDLGHFRIPGLPEGVYVLGGSREEPSVRQASEALVVYGLTYFPGRVRHEDAEEVTVRLGHESPASFALVPTRPRTVAGTVTMASGHIEGRGSVRLTKLDGGVQWARIAPINEDGSFMFRDAIPPGEFAIAAAIRRAGGRGIGPSGIETHVGEIVVRVEEADIVGLQVSAVPEALIEGRVSVGDSESEILPPQLQVVGRHGGAPGNWPLIFAAPVRPDGSFQLRTGSRVTFISVESGEPGWRVKDIVLDGRSLGADGFSTEPGVRYAGVNVVLSRRTTSISGRVVGNRDGILGGGESVVLAFATDPARWHDPFRRYVHAVRANDDGAYEISGLPAGEYQLVAMARIDTALLADPTFLRSLIPTSISILLNESEVVRVDLDLNEEGFDEPEA